jgi:hypothetical protein
VRKPDRIPVLSGVARVSGKDQERDKELASLQSL